jgi:hypothetical protein
VCTQELVPRGGGNFGKDKQGAEGPEPRHRARRVGRDPCVLHPNIFFKVTCKSFMLVHFGVLKSSLKSSLFI